MKYSRQYNKLRNPKVYQTTPPANKFFSKKPLIVLIFLFVVLGGVTIFRWMNSSSWNIQKIAVTGSTHLTESDVQQIFSEEKQKNYFFFNESAFIERIQKQFPLVDSVILQKSFFPWQKGLTVVVTEKNPEAIFVVGNQEVFLDSDGVVMSPSFGNPEGIVRITGLLAESEALQIGNKAINGQMIEQVIALSPRIEQLTGKKIVRVEAIDKRDYQFLLSPTLLVKCSTDKNMVTMLDHLQTILETANRGGLTIKEYIDLRTTQERVR